MQNEPLGTSLSRKALRLWPGVVILVLQWLARFVVPIVAPDALYIGVMGGLSGTALIVVWWLFFSRAPWVDRLGGVALMAIGLYGTSRLLDESIATGGMGMLFPLLAAPVLSLTFIVGVALSRNFSDRPRRATVAAAILLGCGVWTLVRTGGLSSGFDNDLHWRWTKTPEERLLAQAGVGPSPGALSAASAEAAERWPGFRGPLRDSVVRGVSIETDWTASPPKQLWRHAVGPGWSSFAVRGDLIYTQEQRGEEEVVSCYRLSTGEPVWSHRDRARFWESNAGAGPRGTPTLSGGRVYSLGGTGVVNVLDAATGALVWSRDGAADTAMETPTWGFSGSPLVLDDLVLVPVSGRLIAYDLASGEPRWRGPDDGVSYSSPHPLTIDGVPQVLLFGKEGVTSFAPADGAVLWKHAWKGYPIVQPAQTADGDVLVAVSSDSGTRRLRATRDGGSWKVEERWTSIGLKPYFNDFVVHEGHAYGFDGAILSGIDLTDGQRKWKGGRYGNGQLLLLADQDLLLVLSEDGELVLVNAMPDRFEERARFKAIEGKTWNHPALVGDILLVRNAEEMAAFRLAAPSERAAR